jgi:hypothetical protein
MSAALTHSAAWLPFTTRAQVTEGRRWEEVAATCGYHPSVGIAGTIQACFQQLMFPYELRLRKHVPERLDGDGVNGGSAGTRYERRKAPPGTPTDPAPAGSKRSRPAADGDASPRAAPATSPITRDVVALSLLAWSTLDGDAGVQPVDPTLAQLPRPAGDMPPVSSVPGGVFLYRESINEALVSGTHARRAWALHMLLQACYGQPQMVPGPATAAGAPAVEVGLPLHALPGTTMALCRVIAASSEIAFADTTVVNAANALADQQPCFQGAVAIHAAAVQGVISIPGSSSEREIVVAGRCAAAILRSVAWRTCCSPDGCGTFHLGTHIRQVCGVVMKLVQFESERYSEAPVAPDVLEGERITVVSNMIDVAHCIATPPWCIHGNIVGRLGEIHFTGEWTHMAVRIVDTLLKVPHTCAALWPIRPAAGAALLARLASAMPPEGLIRDREGESEVAIATKVAAITATRNTLAFLFGSPTAPLGNAQRIVDALIKLLAVDVTAHPTVPECSAEALLRLLNLPPSAIGSFGTAILQKWRLIGDALIACCESPSASIALKTHTAALLEQFAGAHILDRHAAMAWSRTLCTLCADSSPAVAHHASVALGGVSFALDMRSSSKSDESNLR